MGNTDFEILANNARRLYLRKNYKEAAVIYEKMLEKAPAAWWFAMEAYRSITKHSDQHKTQAKATKYIAFTPNYVGNSYQKLLYSSSESHGFTTEGFNKIEINDLLGRQALKGNKFIIHQHWLKEIYKDSTDETSAINLVDSHISKLISLKCFGAKVFWSLHNLLDHDIPEYQKKACLYAMKRMSEISDKIFVHSSNGKSALEALISSKIEDQKFYLLEHPLYPELANDSEKTRPKELDKATLNDNRVTFSMVGMLRPYKGLQDLADAIQLLDTNFIKNKIRIIVAGRAMDPKGIEKIKALQETHPNSIYLIPRELTNSELSHIISESDVIVAPYRAILTSGTYYAATSLRTATLAPSKGFFPEVVTNNVDGFIYDGSISSLADSILSIASRSKEQLAQIGHAAHNKNTHNIAENFSNHYFKEAEGS